MTKQELCQYEAPSITEYISNDFLQGVIAKYIAFKVNRKWQRYQKRLQREVFIKRYLTKNI